MAKLVRRFPQLGLRCLKWRYDIASTCESPAFHLMKSTLLGHSLLTNRSFSMIENRKVFMSDETTSEDEDVDHQTSSQFMANRRFSMTENHKRFVKSDETTSEDEDKDEQVDHQTSSQIMGNNDNCQPRDNIRRKDRVKFIVENLTDMEDNSKEAVHEALDSWVAWEQNFPVGHLKRVIFLLEKDEQWHRVIQVIKWMLSKGQGNTRGTYAQLIRALDMDNRAEEAHQVWEKKIGFDLHSVPWQLCQLMVAVYHRNNMPERTIKLFKGLEDFDRKPQEKSIVQRVADAYELLGKPQEKERVLEKYKDLFSLSPKKFSSKNKKKPKAAKKAE
ncbi:uncharacterized protein LOC124911294 [Impatiens glandulifera]|uniref:uncharacterized protein LOC124911294 n=1 Tax=Impatiens glandulifera TaxID=253017 RepID=UPI001FB1216A|nr:uncharacterized protein LOC124911294 [Impatiens glandulifera]XP_047307713.1 uncharacterized protein LOC124911294 [Impatiens glandulifera]